MYRNHYGFSEKPFDVTPDPRFLYLTPNYREILASLIYGIQERRGFITIIGEVGTGKTTLLNAAIDRLDDKTSIAFVFNTNVTFEQILSMALYEWGLVKPKDRLSKINAIQRLNNFAIQKLAKAGNVVLIVDEAQNLDNNVMENLRLLSNLETRRHKLVQIVLSGQPELDTKLDQHELRQLAQRISLRRYVFPLSKKDTYAYIQHRLSFAKHSGSSPFAIKAQKLIWEYSGGIPRKINILCDNALLIGYGLKQKKIQAPVVQEAAEDLKWSRFSDIKAALNLSPAETGNSWIETKSRRPPIMVMASIIIVCIFIFVGSFFLGSTELQFPRIADFINDITGVASGKNQPNHENQQMQFSFSDVPEQAVIVHKVVNENVPKIKVESDTHIEDEERKDLAFPDVQIEDKKKSGLNVPVREEKKKVQKVKVKKGDFLSSIIMQTYGTYNDVILNEVLKENPEIINPDLIFNGQVIKIPEDKE